MGREICPNSRKFKPLDCITSNNNSTQNITAHKTASLHLQVFQDLPEDFRHNYFVSLGPC